MSRVRILASAGPGEVRVVAWDGAILDAAVWRPGSPDGVGDLHRGRVGKMVPAMAGVNALRSDHGWLSAGVEAYTRTAPSPESLATAKSSRPLPSKSPAVMFRPPR